MDTYKKGFSLIELIVVIAIIGLLASITTVSLGQSRQKADITKAVSDFRALSHALELYRQENKTLPDASLGMTVTDLVTNYLSAYISKVPSIHSRLLVSPDVYFYTNPVDGYYYNCGTPYGNQEYFISFVPSQQAIDNNEFPLFYERGVETPSAQAERCISLEQN